MIGVISKKGQEWAAEEFFELFKTPWETYRDGASYDVVISTVPGVRLPSGKLVIACHCGPIPFDGLNGIRVASGDEGAEIEWDGTVIPIYGRLATFEDCPHPAAIARGGKAAAFSLDQPGRRVMRIGFDLFEEIERLLRDGQPVERAGIPTLERHIAMLRRSILDAGVPLVEIPPAPYGRDFITCLTHDIDFMGIREHRLDHSTLGFIYRSLVPRYLKGLDLRTAWKRYARNLRAVASLPLVHAGLRDDFWFPLDLYSAAEGDLKSTFFFLPFKDRPGESRDGERSRYRAARYDVARYGERIRSLKAKGCEVGLHGIDAWRGPAAGREEMDVIRRITSQSEIGVRMHWLYFSDETPKHLAEAGFRYDSTLGYNETVGFRSGTTQVFRLPGTAGVFELPLNVQDTAMLYPGRMGVSELEAIRLCEKLIEEMRRHGGVLTINWHDRSLAPERNWDAAYAGLLGMLRDERTWFATAGEAVGWFEKRRAARFDLGDSVDGLPKVKTTADEPGDGPRLALRIHACPRPDEKRRAAASVDFIDRPVAPEEEIAAGY